MPKFTHKLLIFGCLLFTGFCFWKAVPGLIDGADASVVSTTEAAISPSFSHKRGITTPIQDIRPGMRIVGRNPNRLETESTIDPTPEGWRLISIRMLKQDGSYFEAELLRPLSWISRHRAQPGATIELNMPELHVVGAAEVLSISDCPPIDPGDGPVVISTFKNVSNNVLNIYVEGEETPIGVTAGHPIWSEDRQAFIHSEKLQVGEKLRSALGRTVRITSIEPRAGPETVYNLEVASEHVYSITDSGLLVHNTGPCDLSIPKRTSPDRLFVHLKPEQYDAIVSSGYLGRGYQGASKVLLPPFDEGRIWATAYSSEQLKGVRGFFRSISEGLNPFEVAKRTRTIEITGEAAQAFARPRGTEFSYNVIGWLKGSIGTQRQFRGRLQYLGDGTVSSLDDSVIYSTQQLRVYRLGEIERLGIYVGTPASAALWWVYNE